MLLRAMTLAVMTGLLVPIQALALDDPTRPSNVVFTGAADEANTGLQLTSTLVSDGRRLAIINGQTVRQGDSIGSARVLKIEAAEVIVIQDGERKSLALLPSSVKKDKR